MGHPLIHEDVDASLPVVDQGMLIVPRQVAEADTGRLEAVSGEGLDVLLLQSIDDISPAACR